MTAQGRQPKGVPGPRARRWNDEAETTLVEDPAAVQLDQEDYAVGQYITQTAAPCPVQVFIWAPNPRGHDEWTALTDPTDLLTAVTAAVEELRNGQPVMMRPVVSAGPQ